MEKTVKSSEHTATHPSPIENWAFPDEDGAPEKLKFLFPATAAAADVGTLQATWSAELQGVKWQFNTMSLGFNSN